MAVTIALSAIRKQRSADERGRASLDEVKRAEELASAMMTWIQAQVSSRDHGQETGRPPRNNFCFKCGAALHSMATYCADCGVRTPREGDTEVRVSLRFDRGVWVPRSR